MTDLSIDWLSCMCYFPPIVRHKHPIRLHVMFGSLPWTALGGFMSFARRCLAIVLFVLFGLVASKPTYAQATTGLPPFSTIHSGIVDDVKINDGAVLLRLPVWSKPGLIPFSYSLIFNDNVGVNALLDAQIGVPAQNTSLWSPQTTVGLSPSLGWTVSDRILNCNKGEDVEVYNVAIVDGYGTSHPVPAIQWDGRGCLPKVLSGYTLDGSGLYLSLSTSGGPNIIYDRAGNTLSGVGAPNVLTDPNGNQLSFATGVSGSNDTLTYSDPTGISPMEETYTLSNGQITKDVHTWTDPSGNSQSFTINYSLYGQQTNFGCYIPADIPAISHYLPSSITTPVGTYTITYESQVAGTVSGRIAKIVFPSGASIAYTYTGGSNNNGLTCEAQTANSVYYNVMVPVLTRTFTDDSGTQRVWKYDTTQAPNETVVTDPAGNDTVYLFATNIYGMKVSKGIYETQRQIYQGSHTSGTLLKTVLTCYNGNTTSCATVGLVGNPISQKDLYTTLAGMTQYAWSETKYDAYDNLTEDKEYDYSGTLISDRVLVYGTYSSGSCSMISSFILNRVCSDTTTNASGTMLAQTYNTYDAHGNKINSSSLVSGAGNGSGTYISSSATYNSNGTVQYSYDTNQNKTSYTYGNCNSTMLTQVQEPMNLSRSMSWNCAGGMMVSATDENSQTTQFKYLNQTGVADPFWRLTEVDYPDQEKRRRPTTTLPVLRTL